MPGRRRLSVFKPVKLPRRVPEAVFWLMGRDQKLEGKCKVVFWLMGLVEIRNSMVNADT